MDKIINDFIKKALYEDIGTGDITSNACIHQNSKGTVKLIAKEACYISGINLVQKIYQFYDKQLKFKAFVNDGEKINKNTTVFTISGKQHSILATERLVLNCMQRMSGITTKTRLFVDRVKDLKTIILDTRKTCPTIRFLDKEAVKIGQGQNHRHGLYDAIMIKENHIDFAGNVKKAISKCQKYQNSQKDYKKIIIEARNLKELKEIIQSGGVDRIMLDNFSIEKTKKAVKMTKKKYPLESTGNINIRNVRYYALCGVEYISVGSLTHSVKSVDLSMLCI